MQRTQLYWRAAQSIEYSDYNLSLANIRRAKVVLTNEGKKNRQGIEKQTKCSYSKRLDLTWTFWICGELKHSIVAVECATDAKQTHKQAASDGQVKQTLAAN